MWNERRLLTLRGFCWPSAKISQMKMRRGSGRLQTDDGGQSWMSLFARPWQRAAIPWTPKQSVGKQSVGTRSDLARHTKFLARTAIAEQARPEGGQTGVSPVRA